MWRRAVLCSSRITRFSTAKSYEIGHIETLSNLAHKPLSSFSRCNPINFDQNPFQTPIPSFFTSQNRIYSSQHEETEGPTVEGQGSEEMKHQEIEGPTVDRDNSAVAEETRHVTLSLMKTMYTSSNLLALFGLSQLALGSWLSYSGSGLDTVTGVGVKVMSAVGFGFPICLAFLIRRSMKTMHFFNKMEKLERLHILTSTMQILKQLQLLFLRLRPVSILCFSTLSLSLLYSLLPSSS